MGSQYGLGFDKIWTVIRTKNINLSLNDALMQELACYGHGTQLNRSTGKRSN